MGAGFLVPVESKRAAKIISVNLGRDGVAFVQSELKAGVKPLSSLVTTLLSGGTCFAPLEKGEALKEAKQFTAGKWRPTTAIRQWLANDIMSQWGDKGYQLIIEDPWMTPADRDVRKPPMKYFFSGDGVYYAPDSSDMYAALDAAERASLTLFFGFVVSPPVALPPDGKNVDQDYIALPARNTKAVLVRAYDQEGYVVWSTQT